MAPLTRPALLSLVALTLHYSVLSLVLHYSRTLPGPRYHASSAIFLTELGKILVSLALVLRTGELRGYVRERARIRAQCEVGRVMDEVREQEKERERRKERAQEEEKGDAESDDGWVGIGMDEIAREETLELLPNAKGKDKDLRDGDGWKENTVVPVTLHRRTSSQSLSSSKSTSPTSRTGPGPCLSINVSRAQSYAPSTSAPTLALIPATPAPEPSPTRFPDPSSLYPERPLHDPWADRTVLDDLVDPEWWRTLRATVFGPGCWKLAVLAALFFFQGNAQYIASGNLSVPLFQLAYQLKIPATAMCSVILLNRALTRQQWMALFILTFGVGLVQLFSVLSSATPPSPALPATTAPSSPRSSALEALSPHSTQPPNQALGLAAVVAACLSSGFASCYFERILKVPLSAPPSSPLVPTSPSSSPLMTTASTTATSPTLPSTTVPSLPPALLPALSSLTPPKPSLWIRNIQLSFFGLLVGLPVVLWEMHGDLFPGVLESEAEYLDEGGGWWTWTRAGSVVGTFFDGFNAVTWVVVGLQLTGGLLSALVMQHADNLLKCFSTSLSILLSVAASVVLFQFQMSLGITLGALLVLGATFAYTAPSATQDVFQARAWRARPRAGGGAGGGR
ncbi:hypothetical protein JCM1841_000942 [Sporobolomyces salmonicolor]